MVEIIILRDSSLFGKIKAFMVEVFFFLRNFESLS